MQHYSKSHYNLEELKKLLKEEETRIITRTAVKNARELGYISEEEIINEVLKLRKTDIYKTMTCYGDHTLWQDVYKRVNENNQKLYIKLQKSKDGKSVIISFKSDEQEKWR